MTHDDFALRIRMLEPMHRSLMVLALASFEVGQDRIAAGIERIALMTPDEQGAALPWDLIEALGARLGGPELRAWLEAFGQVWNVGAENMLEALARLARQRLAH